jgi:Flp pilus assembly protein TadD
MGEERRRTAAHVSTRPDGAPPIRACYTAFILRLPPRLLAAMAMALVAALTAGAGESQGTQSDAADQSALEVITENIRVLLRTGATERALAELERLLRRAPESFEARILAVEVHYRLGRDAEVERHAAAAAALDPASPEPHIWQARLSRWRARLEEARRHLREALDRQPDSTRLRVDLASLLAADGRRRLAQRHYRRALRGDLADAGAALDAALALADPARRDEALRWVSERHPGHSSAAAWAALSAEAAGGRLWEAEPWAGPLEIPLTLERRSFPVVEARIGDSAPARLLLDTGSPGLKISRSLADSLQARSLGTLRLGGLGSGRMEQADLVLLDALRLGDLVLRRVPAAVLEKVPLGDGLLNPMALGAEAARLDVSRRLLVLGDNERLMPPAAKPLPFIDLDQHPLVRLTLNGGSRLAMIDSGSGSTILDESVVRQIPDRRPMILEGIDFSVSGVLGEVRDARPVHISRLTVGGVEMEDPILFEADLSRLGEALGTEVQVLFGADFLSRFDATFDYRAMEVCLEPAGRHKRRRDAPLRPPAE